MLHNGLLNGLKHRLFLRRSLCSQWGPWTPDLMPIQRVIFPKVFKTMQDVFNVNFVIRPKADPSLRLSTFLHGAKTAMCYVSNQIASGNWNDLEGTVTKEVIQEVRGNIEKWNHKDRTSLAAKEHQVSFIATYHAALQTVDDLNRVQIHTTLHYVPGKEANAHMAFADFEEKAFVANYHFERDYRNKEALTGWTITALNHFRMKDAVMRIIKEKTGQ